MQLYSSSGISDTVKHTREREDEIREEGRQVSASIMATIDEVCLILAFKLMKEASELVEIKLDSLTIQDKNLQLALAKAQSLCDGSISV